MINFDCMTAMARTGRSRSATLVRKDARWNGFAFPDIEQHCGRSAAQGDAD
jgi:hypothetical protein